MASEQKIGALLVEVSANIAKYQEGMAQTQRETQKMVSGVKGHLDTMQRNFKTAVTGMAATLTVGAFAGFIKSAINAADEINKVSQKVGVGVESLSELKYAGELADVSMDQLTTGLRILSRTMFEAAKGSKEQLAAFKMLGIEIKNVDGTLRSTDDVFKDVAEKFSGMEDSAAKTALAMKIFGRSGADLIPMLNAGKAGLAATAKEARALGIVFTDEAAAAAEQFNDNLLTLSKTFVGISIGIVNNVIMPLVSFMKTTMQAQVTWMAFMDKLALVDKFKWSGLIGSQKAELKRQLAIVDEAAFAQINKIEEQFSARGKNISSFDMSEIDGAGGGRGKFIKGLKKPEDKYDLNEAKKAGGLYDWRDIEDATNAIANFTAKLQAPELKQPIFNLGFTAVEFETLEEQQLAATEALRLQEEAIKATTDSLRDLAQRYEDTFGIIAPSALAGAQSALADYNKAVADTTSQSYLAVSNAMYEMEDALTEFVMTGKADFKSLVDSILADIARMTIQKTITGPLSSLLSSGLASLFGGSGGAQGPPINLGWALENANGNAFSRGNVIPFAKGGVVTSATFFPMAKGATGLMGEDGEEAIMPLDRGPDGKLGVRARGGSNNVSISVPVNVNGNNWDERGLREEIETVVHKWVGRHS